jgi:catechol 2,3-dioxygenase-like lactoylglutathione lyase family enzyme
MAIKRLAIVSVPVKDQQAAKQFYTEVLGFTVIRDNPMGPDSRWIQLAPLPGETSITLVTWFPSMPAGSMTGMVLDVDELDATVAQLQSRGVEIEPIQSAQWGRFTTLKDPDGNAWVLQEAADEIPAI